MNHPHYLVLLFACTLGQFLRVMFKAGGSKKSELSGITSIKQYIELNSKFIGGRFVFTSICLFLWMMNPTMVEDLINKIPLVTKYLGHITYPLNAMTVFIWGYLSDSGLDKLALAPGFSWLQKEIPPVPEGTP